VCVGFVVFSSICERIRRPFKSCFVTYLNKSSLVYRGVQISWFVFERVSIFTLKLTRFKPGDNNKVHISLLKPIGFFTYHQVKHSTNLHGSRFAFSVFYGSQNRQRLLLYTSLADRFLQPWWKVFTTRYELIHYIKQITFRL
jgi:hypothetical protein